MKLGRIGLLSVIKLKIQALLLLLAVMSGYSTETYAMQCYLIYDAGSSGTRLFLYKYDNDWVEYKGAKMGSLTSFLSDDDASGVFDAVGYSVASLLDSLNKYSWQKSCDGISVMVYAYCWYAYAGISEANRGDKALDGYPASTGK